MTTIKKDVNVLEIALANWSKTLAKDPSKIREALKAVEQLGSEHSCSDDEVALTQLDLMEVATASIEESKKAETPKLVSFDLDSIIASLGNVIEQTLKSIPTPEAAPVEAVPVEAAPEVAPEAAPVEADVPTCAEINAAITACAVRQKEILANLNKSLQPQAIPAPQYVVRYEPPAQPQAVSALVKEGTDWGKVATTVGTVMLGVGLASFVGGFAGPAGKALWSWASGSTAN